MSGLQEQIAEEFEGQYQLYEAFTAKISGVLRDLLHDAGVEYSAIESRTKTAGSFNKKVSREDKVNKYKTLRDITDISGVRIITFLKEDCEKVSDLIRRFFEVDIKNSINKEDDADPDKFGYRSIHYVVSFSEDRTKLPEYSRFSGLKAEVQIRTILQHTWAAIDWKFRYKNDNEAPRELRRRLYRISALLDAADDEFSLVAERLSTLKVEYIKMIKKGDYDITINIESLSAYFDNAKLPKSILKSAESVGFKINPPTDSSYFGVFKNTMEEVGIKSIADLDKHLERFTSLSGVTFAEVKSITTTLKSFTPSGAIRLAVILAQSKAMREKVFELTPMINLTPEDVARLSAL